MLVAGSPLRTLTSLSPTEEIKDVLTRYFTLKEANEDLQRTSAKVRRICYSRFASMISSDGAVARSWKRTSIA